MGAGLVVGVALAATVSRPAADPVAAEVPAQRTGARPGASVVAAEPAALTAPVTSIGAAADTSDPLALIERAHTAVVTSPGRHRLVAADVALRLGAPLVIARGEAAAASEPGSRASGSASATLRRLRVDRAVIVGGEDARRAARDAGVGEIVDLPASADRARTARQVIAAAADGDDSADVAVDAGALADLVDTRPPLPPRSDVGVVTRPRGAMALQLALAARSVGHTVVTTRARDLRADPRVIERLADLGRDKGPPKVVVGGGALGRLPPDDVAAQVAVAATGAQLPGGGQLVIDPARPSSRRYIALYGVPGIPRLGALGEQSVSASPARVRRLARAYRRATPDDVEVIGTFEIIAAVASASAGRDRNYSDELPVADLEPAVRAARRAGLYVLLDIQPGRADFLSQARRYRRLLRRPHVGLALDPEWRLASGELHLEQIGSVGIDEVNEVADWLADLTRRHRLPQKMFLIHQFRRSMIRDRHRLDTSQRELAYVVQMDGQGPQGTKLDTWRAITATPPDRVWFGWKNFYDEDTPLRSPGATMAIRPPPVFVSYQ